MKKLRGYLGLALALLLLIICALAVYLLSPVLLTPRFIGRKAAVRWYRRFPVHYARLVTVLSLKFVMGVKIVLHQKLPKFNENERVVFSCNHPTTNAIPALIDFIMSSIKGHLIIVAKKEFLTNFRYIFQLGIPLYLVGAIFVDRRAGDKGRASIKKGADLKFKPGTGLLILLDGTRPKAKSTEAGHRRRELATGIDLRQPINLFPPFFSGGYHEIGLATADNPPHPARLAVSFNRAEETVLDAAKLVGAELHLHVLSGKHVMPATPEAARDAVDRHYRWAHGCVLRDRGLNCESQQKE